MPQIFSARGFHFHIWFNDHPWIHFHVRKAGAVIVIEFRQGILRAGATSDMTPADIRRAVKIAEDNIELLLNAWREFHE